MVPLGNIHHFPSPSPFPPPAPLLNRLFFCFKQQDWQGGCQYTLVRQCNLRAPESMIFEVQVSFDRLARASVSVTEAVAVRVPGQGVFVLTRSLATNTYNGGIFTTPMMLADGTTVTSAAGNSKDITIHIPHIGTVRWNGHHLVEVRVTGSLQDKVCGLCGDYDLVQANDLTHVQHGGDYWLVSGKSLFPDSDENCIDPAGEDPHPCGEVGSVQWQEASKYCLDLTDKSERYKLCMPFVDPKQFYNDCIFDHCGAGQAACGAIQLYEERCRALGFDSNKIDYLVDSCGVCGGNDDCGSTCSAFGDPHYITLDQRSYGGCKNC